MDTIPLPSSCSWPWSAVWCPCFSYSSPKGLGRRGKPALRGRQNSNGRGQLPFPRNHSDSLPAGGVCCQRQWQVLLCTHKKDSRSVGVSHFKRRCPSAGRPPSLQRGLCPMAVFATSTGQCASGAWGHRGLGCGHTRVLESIRVTSWVGTQRTIQQHAWCMQGVLRSLKTPDR